MTDHRLGRIPVTTDPDENAHLVELWDEHGGAGITERVLAAGHQPPDARPGWTVAREIDGDDPGLEWVAPVDSHEVTPPGFALLPDGTLIHMGDLPGV